MPAKVKSLIESSFESLLNQLIVKVKRTVKLSSREGDGVIRIKKLLSDLPKQRSINYELSYLGSGKFLLTVSAINYKLAEEFMNKLSNDLVSKGKSAGVVVSLSE